MTKTYIKVKYKAHKGNCYAFYKGDTTVYIDEANLSTLTKFKLWFFGAEDTITIRVSPKVLASLLAVEW